jgi:ABC-type antimicrobial peptide transport system permease subunit
MARSTDDGPDTITTSIILSSYTVLLLIVLYTVTAILMSERAMQQYREIGLLKAVGFTPNQIGAIFLLESASLGVLAVLIGCLLGTILAPILAAPSAETLIDSPSITPNVGFYDCSRCDSAGFTHQRHSIDAAEYSLFRAANSGKQALLSPSRVRALYTPSRDHPFL